MPIDDNFGDEPTKETGTEAAFRGDELPDAPEDTTTAVAEAEPTEAAEPTEQEDVTQEDTAGEEVSADQQQPEAEEQSAGIPDVLLREARDIYGFSEDDLAGYESPEDLTRAMGVIDRRLSDLWTGQQRTRPPQQGQQEQPPPAKEDGFKPSKFELKLDPEAMDESVVKQLEQLNDHYYDQLNKQFEEHSKKLQEVSGGLGQFMGHVEAQQEAAYEQWADDYFNNLPEEYRDIYGQGRLRDMDPRSPQALSRIETESDWRALWQMDESNGRPARQPDEYAQRATRSRHSHITEKTTRDKIRKTATKRRQQAIRRPSAQQTTKVPDKGAFARQWYQEHGIDLQQAGSRGPDGEI